MENIDGIAKKIKVSDLIRMNLRIPPYQRPYTWTNKQVLQLLEDLNESLANNQKAYLVGSIIVYNDSDFYEIVDGQQRITTLSIILWLLQDESLGLRNQIYNHKESKDNIVHNFHTIKQWLDTKEIHQKDFKEFILNNVWFVLINAPSQDEAFVFFDSQNSRGKSLKKHDLLKAHHLRYIPNGNEKVAIECTIFWERIGKTGHLEYLVEMLLGRTRVWSRKEFYNVDILDEFKSQRISNSTDGFFRLNHYHQPPLFEKWRYIDREVHDDDDGLELVYRDIDVWHGSKRIKFVSESKKFLPFQLQQPLEGGEQFFWFVEKYDQLFYELFESENIKIPRLFRKLYHLLKGLRYNLGISYMTQLFEAACLFYYDKFGPDQLLEFSICLEHQLSILRFNKASIQITSISKFVREGDNVFAIINDAAYPEHVFRSLLIKTEGRYRLIEKTNIENGIRKEYYAQLYGLQGFYSKNENVLSHLVVMRSKIKFKKSCE